MVYAVYADEPHAAHAAELLVEAGFQPQQVHVGVEREGTLREAHPGRWQTIGGAMLVGGSLTAAIGDLLAISAAVGLSSFPLGPLAGFNAITVGIFALVPMAVPGALLGWLTAALRLQRREPAFPAKGVSGSTFVGVEVSAGNRPDAELTLIDAHCTLLEDTKDWRRLAQAALHPQQHEQPG